MRVRATPPCLRAHAPPGRAAGRKTLTIKLPMGQRRHRLVSTADHEIGTHMLRRWNERRAPWYRKRKSVGLPPPSCVPPATPRRLLVRTFC